MHFVKGFDCDFPNRCSQLANLFTIRTQPLDELSPKFWEIARPDRLPHASHGVKEEGQIMVGQEDTRQHFARHM
jgi:hypothetical protein